MCSCTIPFGFTRGLFQMPAGLSSEQEGLFTILIAAINERCIECDWNGREVFYDLKTSQSKDSVDAALEEVKRLCDKASGPSVYWVFLGDDRWLVTAVASTEAAKFA